MTCQRMSSCSDINRNKSSAGLSFRPVFDGLDDGKIGEAGVSRDGHALDDDLRIRALFALEQGRLSEEALIKLLAV